MKNVIIFIIIIVSQLDANCIAQEENSTLLLDEPSVGDSQTQAEFNKYFELILSYNSDTLINVDSLLTYKINFVTSHWFNFQDEFYDSLYADSLKLICISRPNKILDSIIKLDFFNPDIKFIEHTKLSGDNSVILKTFSFEKLDPNTGNSYNGSASFHFDADYSTLISFNSGQYLIICERRFSPDIRDSMPPGNDVTYFVERIK